MMCMIASSTVLANEGAGSIDAKPAGAGQAQQGHVCDHFTVVGLDNALGGGGEGEEVGGIGEGGALTRLALLDVLSRRRRHESVCRYRRQSGGGELVV